MAGDSKNKTVKFWTVEFQAQVDFEELEYSAVSGALEMVDNFRSLNDPAYVPIALLEHTVTTTETIKRTMLNVEENPRAVLDKVNRRFADLPEDKKPKSGVEAIKWVVDQTLDVVAGGE